MLKAIIYTRVSSDQQINNTSLDEQERVCKEFCLREKLEVVKVFREEGESAKYIERTKLKEAITFCTKKVNTINFFVVYKFDRFSRSLENHVYLKTILNRQHVELTSASETVERTPSGRLQENILASFAQFDNELRTERTISGMRAKLKQGKWIYPAPLGYIRNPKCEIVPDPKLWDLLQRAWEYMATGEYTPTEIKQLLIDWNYPTLLGKKISKVFIFKFFRNPFYAGVISSPTMKIVSKGLHKPMVSEATFNRIQYMLSANTKNPRRYYIEINPHFTLDKIIRCDSCGYLISGHWSKIKGKYGYYRCPNYDCKKRQQIKKEKLEDIFLDCLESISFSKEFIDLVLTKAEKGYKVSTGIVEQNLQALELDISTLQNRLTKVKELLENGTYSEDVYNERNIKYRIDLGTKLEAKRKITDRKNTLYEKLVYTRFYLENLPNFWLSLSPIGRMKFNTLFFGNGISFENLENRTLKLPSGFEYLRNFNNAVSFGDLTDTNTELYNISEFLTRLGDLVKYIVNPNFLKLSY